MVKTRAAAQVFCRFLDQIWPKTTRSGAIWLARESALGPTTGPLSSKDYTFELGADPKARPRIVFWTGLGQENSTYSRIGKTTRRGLFRPSAAISSKSLGHLGPGHLGALSRSKWSFLTILSFRDILLRDKGPKWGLLNEDLHFWRFQGSPGGPLCVEFQHKGGNSKSELLLRRIKTLIYPPIRWKLRPFFAKVSFWHFCEKGPQFPAYRRVN